MKPSKSPLAIIAFSLFAFILTACAPASGAVLLTLDDIPNGFVGPTILTVGSDFASISFDSGVPTVCNSPFGETTDYGEVATIPMFSGATLDHVLTFANLEPNTTYHYALVATDNNGNVYRSTEDYTFTTNAADDSLIISETNWLSPDSGAVVTDVSSNFGGAANDETWGANSALDGKQSSEWSSAGDGDDAFITIQFAQPIQLSSLAAMTRSMTNDTAQIFSFTVTTETGETFGPFDLDDAASLYEFDVDFAASSLRFDAVETNGGNTGFVDIYAFGEPLE